MQSMPYITQHVLQHGNNRFGSDKDFAAYAHWLEEYARKFGVAIYAGVFMANHVHLSSHRWPPMESLC